MNWLYSIELRITRMDRTEMIMAMGIALAVGALCMRGLSARLR
jgi:hypothetical protein